MRLTLWPSAGQSWTDLLDVVVHADTSGWHGVAIEDHLFALGGDAAVEPRLEATGVLAGLAAVTQRVRLLPLVLSATFRHPSVVASWAATVDHISGGRLTLGVGAGWMEAEHARNGLALGSPAERLRRFDEHCTVVRALLSDATASFSGEFYEVHDAPCEPRPVQAQLPLLIGGKGDRMLGLVARHADAWNMWAMPEVLVERSAALDAHCARIGRDPQTIERTTQALVLLTDSTAEADAFMAAASPRAAFAGTATQFADLVARWEAIGVDEVIVPDWHLGTGARRRDALDALQEAVAAI